MLMCLSQGVGGREERCLGLKVVRSLETPTSMRHSSNFAQERPKHCFFFFFFSLDWGILKVVERFPFQTC